MPRCWSSGWRFTFFYPQLNLRCLLFGRSPPSLFPLEASLTEKKAKKKKHKMGKKTVQQSEEESDMDLVTEEESEECSSDDESDYETGDCSDDIGTQVGGKRKADGEAGGPPQKKPSVKKAAPKAAPKGTKAPKAAPKATKTPKAAPKASRQAAKKPPAKQTEKPTQKTSPVKKSSAKKTTATAEEKKKKAASEKQRLATMQTNKQVAAVVAEKKSQKVKYTSAAQRLEQIRNIGEFKKAAEALEVRCVSDLRFELKQAELGEGRITTDSVLYCRCCDKVVKHGETATVKGHLGSRHIELQNALKKKEAKAAGGGGTKEPTQAVLTPVFDKAEFLREWSLAALQTGTTHGELAVLNGVLKKYFLKDMPQPRTLLGRAEEHKDTALKKTKKALKNLPIGLGIDAGSYKEWALMCVVGYLMGDTALLKVVVREDGSSFTGDDVEEIVKLVRKEFELQKGFVVADQGSVNVKGLRNEWFAWCLGHEINNDLKKLVPLHFGQALLLCTYLSRLFFCSGGRRLRWKDSQKDEIERQQKIVSADKALTTKVSAFCHTLKKKKKKITQIRFANNTDNFRVLRKLLEKDDSASDEEVKQAALLHLAEDVDGDLDTAAVRASRSTSETRYGVLAEVCRHFSDRGHVLPAFIFSENKRKHVPASAREIARMIAGDGGLDATLQQMKEVADQYV